MKHVSLLHILSISMLTVVISSTNPAFVAAAPSPSPSPKTSPTPKASPTPKPSITPDPSADPEASDEAGIDPETIKENIKRRIEQVVKTQNTSESRKKIAFIGTLNSVTTNSFTLETLQGEIKQASNSASIAVIELPKSKEVKFEDISIGDYVAALGYVNETTKVLETKRILTLKTPPSTETKKTTYGTIVKFDSKKSTLTLMNPKTNEEKIINYTKKTTFTISNGTQKQDLDPKKITIDSSAVIIYEVDDAKNTATTVLIKTTQTLGNNDHETPAASTSAKR